MHRLLTRHRTVALTVAALVLAAAPVLSAVSADAAGDATGRVNTHGTRLTVRSEPTSASSRVRSVADGAKITITCQTQGQRVTGTYGASTVWDRLAGGGYVSDAFIFTGSDGLVAPRCAGSTPTPAGTSGAKVKATLAAAKSMTGRYPYSWGGGSFHGATTGICCSPSGIDDRHTVGFDCSGLMEYAFYQGAGIQLPSTSRGQWTVGTRHSLSERRPGDLLFWSSNGTGSGIHHVALYLGDNTLVEADRVSGPDIRVRTLSSAEAGLMSQVVRPIR